MSESFTRSSREGGNLTSAITQDLGRAIVTGKFSDGVVFPYEADLCKQYGVSRPVLREAVKMLTAKGLLKARPRQGTSVQPEDQWNLFDPDVLRWMMERKFTIELMVEFTEVRLAIELDALPTVAGISPMDAAVSGEEYELLVAAPALDAARFERELGVPLTAIGRVEGGAPGVHALLRGERVALGGGFSHFS